MDLVADALIRVLQLRAVSRAIAPLRWVVFRTNRGQMVGREVADAAYTSAKWIRVAVRGPGGTRIVKRRVDRDGVLRLNRIDQLAYKQDMWSVTRLAADIRRRSAAGVQAGAQALEQASK